MDATTEARMNELIDELHAMVSDPENMAQQMNRGRSSTNLNNSEANRCGGNKDVRSN